MKKTTEKINSATIDKDLKDLHEQIRVMRFGMAGSKAKNVKAQGNARRQIARLLTAKNAQK